MLGVGDLANQIKREGRFGQIGITNDQATADILAAINIRNSVIWNSADWKWTEEAIIINLVPNVRQYAVVASSGNPIERILEIIPYDSTGTFLQGDCWIEKSRLTFFNKYQNIIPSTAGNPVTFPIDPEDETYYTNIGQDANGNWNIIVSPIPSIAAKVGGFAKAVFAPYVLNDIVVNGPIKYFPYNVSLDCTLSGCLIDVDRIQGIDGQIILASEGAWDRKIKSLVARNIGVARDNTPPKSELPTIVNKLRRQRR